MGSNLEAVEVAIQSLSQKARAERNAASVEYGENKSYTYQMILVIKFWIGERITAHIEGNELVQNLQLEKQL